MAEITQAEREARHALGFGLARGGLSLAAQLEYDRLKDEYHPDIDELFSDEGSRRRLSSPETRARILEMFKRGNRKYALPFDDDRLAAFSIIGTESWAEYGQVVLQLAMLDTLLSIEQKLEGLGGGTAPPTAG